MLVYSRQISSMQVIPFKTQLNSTQHGGYKAAPLHAMKALGGEEV
jgi:hypothetical protein